MFVITTRPLFHVLFVDSSTLEVMTGSPTGMENFSQKIGWGKVGSVFFFLYTHF
jgi:hypothetical protein